LLDGTPRDLERVQAREELFRRAFEVLSHLGRLNGIVQSAAHVTEDIAQRFWHVLPIDVAPALADGEEEIGSPAVGVRPTLGGREESEQVLDRALQRPKVSRAFGELIVDRQQQRRELEGDRLAVVGLNDPWRVHLGFSAV